MKKVVVPFVILVLMVSLLAAGCVVEEPEEPDVVVPPDTEIITPPPDQDVNVQPPDVNVQSPPPGDVNVEVTEPAPEPDDTGAATGAGAETRTGD